MDFDTFYTYCMAKEGVEETFPFDETTLVMKVKGKMFALTGINADSLSVNLKCDPDWSLELREAHEEIQPGYHMSKKHWNTVDCEGDLPEKLVVKLIDHSYDLVVAKLPKKIRETLKLKSHPAKKL